jgi:hypothetical protein
MSDDIAACRAWGHDWPSKQLRAGRPLPRGYTPKLIEDGYIEVTEECRNNCGKKRRCVLFPGGVYDLDVKRSYVNPRNWPVIHQDEGITRRHIQGEVIRRVHEDIMAAVAAYDTVAVTRDTAPDDQEAARAGQDVVRGSRPAASRPWRQVRTVPTTLFQAPPESRDENGEGE